ncbi:MAG: hypothetical protein H6739_36410 [Alphaproteobacteria bacterium]|nr:hypothetical protein [Alphaproteobacteria bacterium]
MDESTRRVFEAVEALQRGDPARAEALLRDALPALASPSVRARALGLQAQALLALGRAPEARDALRGALRLARDLNDPDGLHQLRALNGRVYARLAEDQHQARLAADEAEALDASLEALLAAAETPRDAAMVFVRKANQALDQGEDALALAREGLARALACDGATREQVLALLCVARAEPERRAAHLERARGLADRADETALLTAVARAAEDAGVPFAPRVFGADPVD